MRLGRVRRSTGVRRALRHRPVSGEGDTTPFVGRSKVAVEGPFSAGLELAPTLVRRHPDQLPGGRWLFLRRRTQTQTVEDASDGQLVGDVGIWSVMRASHSTGSMASKLRPSDGFMRER